MPLALSLVPIDGQFDGYRSVMFVACNVCPRMHFAWEHHQRLLSPAMLLGRGADAGARICETEDH